MTKLIAHITELHDFDTEVLVEFGQDLGFQWGNPQKREKREKMENAISSFNKYAGSRQEQLASHREAIDESEEREEIRLIRKIFRERPIKRQKIRSLFR